MKGHYKKYPAKVIQQLNPKTFLDITIRSLRNKDYDGFKYLISSRTKHGGHIPYNNYHELLKIIAGNLDVDAIKSLVDIKMLDSSDTGYLLSLVERHEKHIYPYEEIKQRKEEIYTTLLKAYRYGHNTDIDHLELLYGKLSKEEFEEFCKARNIDLTKPGFKALSLNLTPDDALMKLKNVKCADPIDIILSRTFSKAVTKEQAKEAYSYLYSLDKLSKEMLDFFAMKIAQSDSIKIIIDPNSDSYYDYMSNIIRVGEEVLKDKEFTLPEVLMYGINSYFNEQILNRSLSHNYLKEYLRGQSKVYEEFDLRGLDTLKEILPAMLDIRQAIREPLYKAAELVGNTDFYKEELGGDPIKPYSSSAKDITDIFISNPIFFILALHSHTKTEEITPEIRSYTGSTDNIVLVNLLNIYLEHNSPGELNYTELDSDSLCQFLADWSLNTFLPKKMEELNLTNGQKQFLEMISIYLLNEYDEVKNNSPEILLPKFLEGLILSYPLLKATGVEQELLDSFQGVVDVYDKYASPIVREQLNEYYKECEELGMPSEDYQDQYHEEL